MSDCANVSATAVRLGGYMQIHQRDTATGRNTYLPGIYVFPGPDPGFQFDRCVLLWSGSEGTEEDCVAEIRAIHETGFIPQRVALSAFLPPILPFLCFDLRVAFS
jgi:hypothetical protein